MENKKTVSSYGRKGKFETCETWNSTVGSMINNSMDHANQCDSFWNRS